MCKTTWARLALTIVLMTKSFCTADITSLSMKKKGYQYYGFLMLVGNYSDLLAANEPYQYYGFDEI